MAQYLRPDGTTLTGGWAATGAATIHECTDEDGTSGDTDYAAADPADTTFEVTLSDVTDPVSAVNHVLRIWSRSSGSKGGEKYNWALYEGTGGGRSTIASANNITANRSSNFAEDVTYTLSEAEANSISDYTDLHVAITVGSLDSGETMDIGSIRLEVPDVQVTRDRMMSIT
jgi:hypothetical protein